MIEPNDLPFFLPYRGLQQMGLSDTVFYKWPRPWNGGPPAGRWRFFMCSCDAEGVTENTPENLVDLLRGMVDTGLLQPDDVVRDIVLLNGSWAVRGWRHA